jgi:hypothetical protein
MHGAQYTDHSVETFPVGVFQITQSSLGYGSDGLISLTCPDRWWKIQTNRFGLDRSSIPSNPIWAEIQRLVEGAWPPGGPPFPGWALMDKSATAKVGPLVWTDGSRENAILQLAQTGGVEVFFDATGRAVMRKKVTLTVATTPVYRVDADTVDAVFINGTLTADLTLMRNAVIVTSSASDLVLTPVEVKNSNPSDPLSTVGPLGYVPVYYSSPLIRNPAQATAAGRSILARQLASNTQLQLTCAPNLALDAGDVIDVVLPPVDPGAIRQTQRSVIESVTLPLTPKGAPQQITTQATRPDDQDGLS